jgi:hypothetical protein
MVDLQDVTPEAQVPEAEPTPGSEHLASKLLLSTFAHRALEPETVGVQNAGPRLSNIAHSGLIRIQCDDGM